jgi:pimeloyl-ACP methyl ester carboxylesterase
LFVCGHGPHDDRDWAAAYHAARQARGELEPTYRVPPNGEVNAACTASFRRYIKRPTLWRDIARLDVPTLIVTAEHDIRPAWPALQLAETLPRARHVTIAGAEHAVWLTHEDELGSALRDFLAELD